MSVKPEEDVTNIDDPAKIRRIASRMEVENATRHVYVLRCERPCGEPDHHLKHQSEVLSKFDEVPLWMDRALNLDSLGYVGETGNLAQRMEQHATRQEKASLFTQLFPVSQIYWVGTAGSEEEAVDREGKLRDKLNRIFGDELFAYADLGEDEERWEEKLDSYPDLS